MDDITFNNIQGCELPFDWAQRLDVYPDELVSITIHRNAPKTPRKRFDQKAIQVLLTGIAELPVLDNRTPEEIVE